MVRSLTKAVAIKKFRQCLNFLEYLWYMRTGYEWIL